MKTYSKGVTEMRLNNTNIADRIKIYKKYGFDFVSFDWSEDMTFNNFVIELCKQNKIIVDDIHLLYDNANEIWLSENNNYIDYVKKAIDDISKDNYVKKDVIIHISRTTTPPEFSEIGVKNVIMLNEYAKSKNVNLCFENLKRPDYLVKLLDKTDINVCFDIGHANLYMDNYFDFLNKYSDRIITNHLHDNFGDTDSHLGLFMGNIDWGKSIKMIKNTSCKKLHIECFPTDRTASLSEFEKFVCDNYTKLTMLEKM